MKNPTKAAPVSAVVAPAPALRVDRFLASVRAEGGDAPHPSALALAKQPRSTIGKNRRLSQFLRIDSSRGA